ncbi:MAG: endolytic transglycosylase MltG [Patescibacteria group bacterium]
MKSKGKGFITGIIFIIIALFAFFSYKEGVLPVDKKDTSSKIFIVKPGDGPIAITKNLKNEEFIRNELIFFLIVKMKGIEKNLQAGDFRLSKSMNLFEITNELQHGTLDIWVTIQEGMRKEEIAELLAKQFNISTTEFNSKAKEGYLFPDTYLIPKQATIDTILSIFQTNYENKFTSELKQKAASHNLTEDQVLTLASLIEREAKLDSDRQQVANIIRRRLKEGIPLQIDASVQYAVGYDAQEQTWWRTPTIDDLSISSIYNTYKNPGVPPSPICNPGLASITAVANSTAETPYLFYVSDKNGRLHFARNSDEHEANQQKYLKYLRQ